MQQEYIDPNHALQLSEQYTKAQNDLIHFQNKQKTRDSKQPRSGDSSSRRQQQSWDGANAGMFDTASRGAQGDRDPALRAFADPWTDSGQWVSEDYGTYAPNSQDS